MGGGEPPQQVHHALHSQCECALTPPKARVRSPRQMHHALHHNVNMPLAPPESRSKFTNGVGTTNSTCGQRPLLGVFSWLTASICIQVIL